jgi:hypothetical protein
MKLRCLSLSVLALSACAAAFAIIPAGASAVTCEAGLRGGGPSAWIPDPNNGDFEDAVLFTNGLDTVRDDAFDGYSQAFLDASPYDNPSATSAGCDRNDARTKLVYPGDNIGGVRVRPMLLTDRSNRRGRVYVSLTNTTGAPVTFDFRFDGNLGSDTNTNVARTSNGDGIVQPADRWATSCEDQDADGCAATDGNDVDRDPELAHNWEGKQAEDSADTIDLADGADTYDVTFEDVTIGSNKTKAYMEVVTLNPTIGTANKAANQVDDRPGRSGVFAGLSDEQKTRLRNW